MPYRLFMCGVAFLLSLGFLVAQEGIRQGKIKSLDLEKKRIIITVGDRDVEVFLDDNTRIFGAQGTTLKDRLEGFKEGMPLLFKTEKRDQREVAVGLKKTDGKNLPGQPLPKADLAKLIPLTELGSGKYQGFEGGLYPGGKNERPAAHEAAGIALARQIQPLDAQGKPSPQGKVVLLSIGMSNTAQASQGFMNQLHKETARHPNLVFINGAVGGMTASVIQDPNDNGRGAKYWAVVDDRLRDAGVTRDQVQAVWIKQADAGPKEGFPGYAKKLQGELGNIVRLLSQRFPNLKVAYLSSRIGAGFAKTGLNPEPYAYESGFSVKWLVAQQIDGEPSLNFDPKKGAVKAPWLSWGPYLWASGGTKRADGFFYQESDFAPDGTHHSPAGSEKIGRLMLDFFKNDSTTRPWFLKP